MLLGAGEKDLRLEKCELADPGMLDGLAGDGPGCKMGGTMTKMRSEQRTWDADFVTYFRFSIAFKRKRMRILDDTTLSCIRTRASASTAFKTQS